MNDIIFVARIHNGSLGTCVRVNSFVDGENVIRDWVRDQFGRDITEDENEILVNTGEFYSDEDADNEYTFSLGMLE